MSHKPSQKLCLINTLIILCFLGNSCVKTEYPPNSQITSIDEVTHTTAIVQAELLSDGIAHVYTGVVYALNPGPTLEDSIIEVTNSTNSIRIALTGLLSDTNYYIRSYTKNSGAITYGNEQTFKTKKVDLYVDARDGNSYPEIPIFSQVWMGENMRYNIPEKSIPVKDDYDEIADEKMGFLYLAEVFDDVCPSGWHVPTDEDWKELEMAVGIPQDQLNLIGYRGSDASALREPGTTHWDNDDDFITNAYGFTALPAGQFGAAEYTGYGARANFWTAPNEGDTSFVRMIDSQYLSSNKGIRRIPYKFSSQTDGPYFSVRCVKNK